MASNYNSANIDTTLGIVRVASGMVTFDTTGALDRESVVINYNVGTAAGTAGTVVGKAQVDFVGATANQAITYNFGSSKTTDGAGATGLDGTTQFGSPNGLVSQTQDGYGAGSLQAFLVDTKGVISGRFSNGQIRSLAQVTLAKFPNPLGLVRSGKNLFAESADSGQPLKAAPDSAGLGKVASNSLELSNVDLGEEFINMIAAQRGFQANSKAITTVDEMLQELVNIKR
ncbi:MAG: flagellar hook-basal body complex protein [Nitrospirae bacterium]|nr:MAG: flagellar hook-basal body complex protein [Nitrospirota bacterium]